jgi:superfamily II DNA or RNA helicase
MPGEDQMAAGLRAVVWSDRYSTSSNDPVEDFYKPAIRESQRYDRATGFFRSSFFALTGSDIGDFALRGGRIRLLCSPELEKEDIEAIREGSAALERGDDALRKEIARVLEHPHAASGSEILAALYVAEHLEIRLAVPVGDGIFHDKFGIFHDPYGNLVSFVGSINESWHAWHPYGNHESFEVFTSWGPESQRPLDHVEIFDQLWNDEANGLQVAPPSERALDALLDQLDRDPVEVLREISPPPKEMTRKSLMPHQRRALKGWRAADRRGILKHATGSGKTVTALEAVREQVAGKEPVLIVVPSTLLLEQWDAEIRRELADQDPAVLLAGGGNSKWKGLVGPFTEPGDKNRILIATMATACGPQFLDAVREGEHLLLVADEVHRLGAGQASNVLTIDAGARLGLSATPERAGDPEGTAKIFDYFGGIIEPEFSLADAVAAGRLCRYEYHVRPVGLTAEEEEDWAAISDEIRALMARSSDEGERTSIADLDPYLKSLLIQRARIAKGASKKAPAAAGILATAYKEGDRWLVYCDDVGQLEDVRRELKATGLASMPYFADMEADRVATLASFELNGGIVVAIKCLDEGVDIPSVSHALIAASSRNPREFVQRRGRVLRVAPGKHHAVIFDLMVDPPAGDEGEYFRSLILGELARADEFAQHASNPSAQIVIHQLAIKHGVDPDTLASGGYEEEDSYD